MFVSTLQQKCGILKLKYLYLASQVNGTFFISLVPRLLAGKEEKESGTHCEVLSELQKGKFASGTCMPQLEWIPASQERSTLWHLFIVYTEHG